jgi:hypothetical protein
LIELLKILLRAGTCHEKDAGETEQGITDDIAREDGSFITVFHHGGTESRRKAILGFPGPAFLRASVVNGSLSTDYARNPFNQRGLQKYYKAFPRLLLLF